VFHPNRRLKSAVHERVMSRMQEKPSLKENIISELQIRRKTIHET
jgi:hypothetical protein